MATTIDELVVRIKADTAELERALPRIEKPLNRADSSTQKLSRSFSKLKAAILTAAAAAASISIATKKIVDVGIAFEDLQTSLNAVFGSVEAGKQAFEDIKAFAQETPFQLETATQAFINLKASGIEPNISQLKTFANVASVATDSVGAFEALVRVTQRASQGTVQLEELNILADRGIPVFTALERTLKLTRDEVTEFGSTSEGAAKIMEALTRGLQEITGDAMGMKMGNLSVKVSNLEIALKEAAQAIFEEGGLGKRFKAFTDQATADVELLTIKLKSLFTGAPEEFFAAESPEEGIKILRQAAASFRAMAKGEGGGFSADVMNAMDSLGRALLETVGLEAGENFFDKRAASLEAMIVALEKSIAKQKESNSANTDGANTNNAAADAEKARRDAVSALTKIVGKNKDEFAELQSAITLVNAELELLLTGGESKFTESQLSRVLAELQEQMDDLTAPENEVGLGALKEAVLETSNAFTNDFVQGLMNGQTALVSFRDFAKDLVSQIITIFLQLEVVNRIINSVLGLSGNAALPTGGIISPAKNRAGGGSVNRNSAMVVGERGPEIFIPHSAGVIRNNHDSRNMMGGSGIVVNQSLNFSTGVVPTVRAEVQKMLPDISEVTKVAVLEASARGGSFRKGLIGA